MRRMAFPDSASEVRERLQTVTRRPGWRFLKPNDLIQAIEFVSNETGTGGGSIARELAVLRVRSVRVEPLSRLVTDATYAEDELPREGRPCWSRDHFIATFLRRHRLSHVSVDVTRIEFEYVDAT
jgi:hypothetical protein